MRLIDADGSYKLRARDGGWRSLTFGSGIICAFDELEGLDAEFLASDIPAVDAVPVVRCKDCEHYSGSSGLCNIYLRFSIAVRPDDFCSHGGRRTT